MAATAHQHHAVHPSDLEVLDAVTMGHAARRASTSSSTSSNSAAANGGQRRRPLDTLQALRRPPIDPIVLAASLSSGPHVTRHHFLHSFGPKTESKQMARSERLRRQREEEEKEAEEARRAVEVQQNAASNSTGTGTRTRGRAGSYANCDADDIAAELLGDLAAVQEAPAYRSSQAPRSERLRAQQEAARKRAEALQKQRKQASAKEEEQSLQQDPARIAAQRSNGQPPQLPRPDIARAPSAQIDKELVERKIMLQNRQSAAFNSTMGVSSGAQPGIVSMPSTAASMSSIVRPPPMHVRCYARTRIPTPHGEILCHLYRNNRDNKEHLALVVDPEQNAAGSATVDAADDDVLATANGDFSHNHIRSRTLDEVWGPSETEMERIVRGAYVGRLSSTYQVASRPKTRENHRDGTGSSKDQLQAGKSSLPLEPPLVRIHSECYTGETIGSQRCDCGEQLDEAIRLIHADARPAKGVVVYLRQEGRGIGLLDKLMAYNLQDMGHDTVSANILLGHLADARKYDIAAEILRDLGVTECRLLTNNPEKMDAMEAEGIHVAKRVPMVPRIWRAHRGHHHHSKHGQSKHSKPHRHPISKRTARKTVRAPRIKKESASHPLESSIVSQFDDGARSTDEGGLGESAAEDCDRDDDGDLSYASSYESGSESDSSRDSYAEHVQRRSGATMVGGSMARGPELEKYLRTKVERMGHLLDLPPEEAAAIQQLQQRHGDAEPSSRDEHEESALSEQPPFAHLTNSDGQVPRSVEEKGEGDDDKKDQTPAVPSDGDEDEILIQSHGRRQP